ncbi:MAG TPA: AAA family ATPase [Frankiaceae bacterium]|nr:AAA family ATPase [Frankiaceae bacterium]
MPSEDFARDWDAIILPADMKSRMLRQVAATVLLRDAVDSAAMPLHGTVLLTGAPGVGKTTVARGLAHRVALAVPGLGEWLYLEINPHTLVSSSLGRSQRSVEQLFGTLLTEQAAAGPLVVLLDEVETLVTDRSALSMDANPVDVHRAVDAALVGLDALAREHRNVVIIATSNVPQIIDSAFLSRADWTIEVPLPDRDARATIVRHTLTAVAEKFPPVRKLITDPVIAAAAEAADGLDARAIRKSVAAACALDPAAAGDPAKLTKTALLTAMRERSAAP